MLAAELLFHPERNRRFDLADQALALAWTTSDADATFDVIAHRLLCTLTPATVESCWRDADELTSMARASPDPHRFILAAVVRYVVGVYAGQLDLVVPTLLEAHDLARELGQPMLRWFVQAHVAGVELFAGRLERAEALATEAFSLGVKRARPTP